MDYTRRVATRTCYQIKLFDPQLYRSRSTTRSARQCRRRRITVRSAASMHASPVDSLEERRELSRTQLNHAVVCVRPHEATPVQALIKKTHPIGVVPE